MKKKYFSPEMEEMEVETPDLLVGSLCNGELPPPGGEPGCPDNQCNDF